MKNVNHLGELQHRISAFDPQRVQREALLRIVKPNEHCEYGRKHRFAGIGTVAEYAENGPIIERLRELGVQYAQGYGVEKPRAFAEVLTELSTRESQKNFAVNLEI